MAQPLQGAPQQPGDLHLRAADACADLPLGELVHVGQLDHLPLPLGKLPDQARQDEQVLGFLSGAGVHQQLREGAVPVGADGLVE